MNLAGPLLNFPQDQVKLKQKQPIGVVTKIGANRNWQCELPTQIGSNQTANLKVAVLNFHNFLCAIIQAWNNF